MKHVMRVTFVLILAVMVVPFLLWVISQQHVEIDCTTHAYETRCVTR